MRAWGWVVTVAALCGLVTGAAVTVAAPQGGFGLAAGLVVHRSPAGVSAGDPGPTVSAGASLAGDAQFVVNDRWSLNPYLLLSLERSGSPANATHSNGAAGLELRRWWGDRYLGVRGGEYVELLVATRVSTSYGTGIGLALGAEAEDGLTWGVTLDGMRIGYDQRVHVGLRLHLGRRWGGR